jgi:Rod binding domain-containing protein
MFTIDLTLKHTPLPLSVQRKSAEEAEATFQEILKAMRSASPQLLELGCDRQPEKKIGVFSDQISAVIISEKSSTAASGRPPGFFALAE